MSEDPSPKSPESNDFIREAVAGDLAFGTIDAWLMWNLCGQHVTDVTNASRTMLMNISALDWDEDLLAVFDIPRSVLPRIVSSSRPVEPMLSPLSARRLILHNQRNPPAGWLPIPPP